MPIGARLLPPNTPENMGTPRKTPVLSIDARTVAVGFLRAVIELLLSLANASDIATKARGVWASTVNFDLGVNHGKSRHAHSPCFCVSPPQSVISAQVSAQPATPHDRPASAAAILPAIMAPRPDSRGHERHALTVFQGVKPESMDVEFLALMHNANGPKEIYILVDSRQQAPNIGSGCGHSGSPFISTASWPGRWPFALENSQEEPMQA